MNHPELPEKLRIVIEPGGTVPWEHYKWSIQGFGTRYSFFDDEEVEGWWPYSCWHNDIFENNKFDGYGRTFDRAEAKARKTVAWICQHQKDRITHYFKWADGRVLINVDCDS